MKTILDVIIIGGGFSGLTAGYYAKQAGLNFKILEASDRIGGVLESEKIDGYLIEKSANTLLYSPSVQKMVKELGLEERVIFSEKIAKNRFIWKDDKLHSVPLTPQKILFSPLLGWQHKARLLYGLFCQSPVRSEQTIEQFFTHYFGQYFSQTFADAMISGIWAGDISKLSMDACFSDFKQKTLQHKSLFKTLSNQGKNNAPIFSFVNGVSEFVQALEKNCLQNIETKQKVIEITHQKYFTVQTQECTYHSQKIIFCAPIEQLPSLMSSCIAEEKHPKLVQLCESIPYAPLHLVYTAFSPEAIDLKKLEGFGFLIPQNQHRRILGAIFSSSIFQNRAPNNEVLITTFIGGEHFREVNKLSKTQIYDIVNQELREILKITQEPIWQHHIGWQKAVPQYHMGHQQRIKQIIDLIDCPNFLLNANWHDGTALPKIIKKSSVLFSK
jgi:oxygen-dependent protoporphyrinogen oxidase